MNLSKYRQFLLLFSSCPFFENNPWEQVLFQVVDPGNYAWLHQRVDVINGNAWGENHPLVNKGVGYWMNNTTLCLGYVLKQLPTIYRPIFSHKRENQINKFLPNIPIVVIKRKKYLIFVEIMRIKKIPSDIIREIMRFI